MLTLKAQYLAVREPSSMFTPFDVVTAEMVTQRTLGVCSCGLHVHMVWGRILISGQIISIWTLHPYNAIMITK